MNTPVCKIFVMPGAKHWSGTGVCSLSEVARGSVSLLQAFNGSAPLHGTFLWAAVSRVTLVYNVWIFASLVPQCFHNMLVSIKLGRLAWIQQRIRTKENRSSWPFLFLLDSEVQSLTFANTCSLCLCSLSIQPQVSKQHQQDSQDGLVTKQNPRAAVEKHQTVQWHYRVRGLKTTVRAANITCSCGNVNGVLGGYFGVCKTPFGC